MKLSIKNLQNNGNTKWGKLGWIWSVDGVTYWTNAYGHGLFYEHGPNDHRQILGTIQFSLSPIRKRAYNKIRRYFLQQKGY